MVTEAEVGNLSHLSQILSKLHDLQKESLNIKGLEIFY